MKVLVVVDMQNDFISGSLGTKEALKIVDNVILKIKDAEENNDIILFTKDTHDKDYLNTFEGAKLPVPHCIKNTIGWEIPKEILRNHQVVFEKETLTGCVVFIRNVTEKIKNRGLSIQKKGKIQMGI